MAHHDRDKMSRSGKQYVLLDVSLEWQALTNRFLRDVHMRLSEAFCISLARPKFFLLISTLILLALSGIRRARQMPFDRHAIDRFIAAQMAAHRVPGLAMAITHGDQVLYVKGYGRAREGHPVTPETQFFIASLSKSFTALAVMQLMEAGKIDLDTPVQSYLPEFKLADPLVASQITIRQLLNQTSGLADAGFPEMRLPQPATPAERVASLRTAHPVAQPGTEHHYHNVNYQILARVVEAVSGQMFSEYLHTHIFASLRMSQTISALTSAEALGRADNLAQGHLIVFGIPIESAEESGYLGGSGGMISTATDMANYLIMQTNEGRFKNTELLSSAGMALMHTPPENIDSNYAMGWIATMEDGVRVLEHNGILSTFYADMVLLPESGHGIVLLYNIQSLAHDSLGFPQIKRGLIAMLSNGQPPTSGVNVGTLEIIFGILTLASVVLSIRSLLRLPCWIEHNQATTPWRLAPSIFLAFLPAALVLAMPILVLRTSGRAFSFVSLFRSMPEVMAWLSLTGVLSVINITTRLAVLVRRKDRST